MSTCRFCGNYILHITGGAGEIKYGTRHYAHDLCFLNHKGIEGLKELNSFQLGKFTLGALNKSGIRPAFETIYNARIAKENLKTNMRYI